MILMNILKPFPIGQSLSQHHAIPWVCNGIAIVRELFEPGEDEVHKPQPPTVNFEM